MAGYNDLVNVIKEITTNTVEKGVPTAVMFGTVVSESPLQIKVDQHLTLDSQQLVLCRNVLDYDTDMTVNHITEKRAGGSGDSSYASHNHQYKGRKKFRVHHKLLSGDMVLLIRATGGQKFAVIDRVTGV